MRATKLRYDRPAADWLEGLPVGSGRLAAMVLGGVKTERIALNHEWLWRGVHRERDNRQVADRLPAVRELLLAGDFDEGTEEGNKAFACSGGEHVSGRVDAYQPAGDLCVEFNHPCASVYRRELDLDTAMVSVSYDAHGCSFQREVMAHLEEDLILARFTFKPQWMGYPFACRIWLDRNIDPDCDVIRSAQGEVLVLEGRNKGGTAFALQARVFPLGEGASLAVEDGCRLVLTGAEGVLIALDAATDRACASPVEACRAAGFEQRPWEDLVADHVAAYKRFTGSFSITLDLPESPDHPTDRRMELLRAGEEDPSLALLYYNYGRYLLTSSSARGELPANLQGKWNEDLNPPWQADYHHDVNLEMNYWPAETGGMERSVEALLQHIERFVPHARKAARDLYGCAGVWYPIQTDAWGRSTPESFGWAVWVGAAPWLAQHMWWHYEYGLDERFLRERAYPFMKEVAAFFEDYLIEGDDGKLMCVPSQSPENTFKEGTERFPVVLCVNASMDVELVWDLLSHLVQASEVLGLDDEKRAHWTAMLGKLPELRIGSKGQLMEWPEEYTEVDPGHRHVSHLFGLYPGEQFCPHRSPELFKAAGRSLELRLAAGGGHTGWSRAWVACLFARMGQGNKALEQVEHLVTDFASSSLLDLHPPRIFQIDGNLGGVAAVQEMLLQSYYGEIHILPALPDKWPSGCVEGLRARGAFTIGIDWQGGAFVEARILSRKGGPCKVLAQDQEFRVEDGDGCPVAVARDDRLLTFATQAGGTYRMVPAEALTERGGEA